jgi:hypothetical protein
MDLCDPVLEGRALDVVFHVAILESSFEGNELTFLESFGELREIPPGIDPVPFGAGLVFALIVLPAFLGGDVEDDELTVILSGFGFCILTESADEDDFVEHGVGLRFFWLCPLSAVHACPEGVPSPTSSRGEWTESVEEAPSEADSEEGILSMLMGRLNSVLPQVKEAQMYATFTGLRLNRDGQLFYGMAASPPLLHWSASSQRIDRIQEEQFPLGLLEGTAFSARELAAGSGDLILVATDGIYEVCSGREVEFGIDALEDLLARHASQPLREIASVILQAVHGYGKQLDDQTLLIVRKMSST